MSDSQRTDARRREWLHEEKVSNGKVTPIYIADHIRRMLKDGGSAPHSEDVQRFFKEEIQSRGW